MSYLCPPEFIALAHRMSDAAQPIARRYFRTDDLVVEQKTAHDPVTMADREIEETWREMIFAERPNDAIWGEEYGRHNEDAELTWIFDPIDGTKAFTLGRATFGTMIGLHHKKHGFILGVVDQPIVHLRWSGARGHGAFLNDKRLHSKAPDDFSDVRIALTNPVRLTPDLKDLYINLADDIGFFTYGGDCMNYTGLADGSLHVVFDSLQKIYDVAAIIPIIEEAGGIITHKDGAPIGLTIQHTILAASTPQLHEEILDRYQKILT